jgi:hypothetical protein
MGNTYLDKKKEREQTLLDIGVTCGKQQIVDYLTIALHDASIMGKDTFGRERIEKVLVRLMQLDSEFSDAYTVKAEADYLQEKLDRSLREIYGDELIPFSERQPYVKQMGYKKSRKGWV